MPRGYHVSVCAVDLAYVGKGDVAQQLLGDSESSRAFQEAHLLVRRII